MKNLLLILLLSPLFAAAQTVTTIAGTGIAGFTGDTGPATAAQLQSPSAIAFDKNGNMYIVDGNLYVGNYRVRKVNTSGIITTIAGNGTNSSTGDNGPATAAGISPLSITTDTSGNVYISETNRIRKISAAGIITTIAGDGTLGYNGDGIPATGAKVYNPYLGFADALGALYFSDHYNHRIRKIDAAGIISTIAGAGTNGSSGDGGPATAASFLTPIFLAGNAEGDLLIPDNGARRIRKVDTAGIITAFAGMGAGGNGGDGGLATNAALGQACSVVCDDSGNVYIAMGSANTVRKVNTSGIITTIAGNRDAGYSGDGGPAALARFNSVNHIAIYNGNLYLADMYNNCIRRIGYNTTGINTLATNSANITIHPNPANNEITISAAQAINSIVLVNVAGQAISMPPHCSGRATGTEVTCDISALPVGVYIVRVNGEYAQKVIKK